MSKTNENKKKTEEQTYKYSEKLSIIYNLKDDYELTEKEYYKLYSFFVTYSLCNHQSDKKRAFKDYGWEVYENNKKNQKNLPALKDHLQNIINLDEKDKYIFSEENNLKECFINNDLTNGTLKNFDTERLVIGKTHENNKYLKLFYRIRNGLAHARFRLKFSSTNEKMIVIQDNSNNNVTARIVLKLQTVLDMINLIDKNNLIDKKK